MNLATLGGILNVRLINGFRPDIGHSFQVLLFGSRSRDFATVNLTDLGSDRILQWVAASLTLVTNQRP